MPQQTASDSKRVPSSVLKLIAIEHRGIKTSGTSRAASDKQYSTNTADERRMVRTRERERSALSDSKRYSDFPCPTIKCKPVLFP